MLVQVSVQKHLTVYQELDFAPQKWIYFPVSYPMEEC